MFVAVAGEPTMMLLLVEVRPLVFVAFAVTVKLPAGTLRHTN